VRVYLWSVECNLIESMKNRRKLEGKEEEEEEEEKEYKK
jgi:hypothetical protein